MENEMIKESIKEPARKVILTGDRPTGRLHVGHYAGSLRRRVELQNSGEYKKTFIMIADAQALTDNAEHPEKVRQNIIQVALDYLACGIDPEKFMAYIRSKVVDDGMYYLLLDEIQMLDCFEAVLNGYLRKDNMDVFVTGSNAKLLSKDIATEFAGRGDEIHMYPLSFAEFMNVYNGDKYMGLSEYMLYGGIPLVVLREDANDKAAALLINTV